MMTPRERWLALLTGQRPDRIPTDYRATAEVTARLFKELKCDSLDALYQRLHVDGYDYVGAPHRTGCHPADPQADIWGIRFQDIDYGTGVYREAANHPLADLKTVADVNAYAWPRPEDHDFDAFRQKVKAISGRRIVLCGGYEPYLLYCWLRGMEQAMVDLIECPDVAEAILGRIFDYHYGLNARMFEIAKGRIDMTFIAEDLGSQTGLLMGLDQIRRFILPNQKKMGDLARAYGLYILYHTDGAARDVIPDLINVTGIHVLDPIQWRCPGMEREGLVRDFGARVVFHGGMDNQRTMPFGTEADVRAEVLDNIRIFSAGRWICGPCHNIQPVTPTGNIVTMYETIHEHGRL